jgi:hypothetical protein
MVRGRVQLQQVRATWPVSEANSRRGSGSSAATSKSGLSDRPTLKNLAPVSQTAAPQPPPDRYKRLSALPPPDRPAPAAPSNRGASSGSGYLDLQDEQASFGDMFKGLGLRKSMTFDDSYASTPAVKKVCPAVCDLTNTDRTRLR